MDADRQVDKFHKTDPHAKMTPEQRQAMADKLRMHEEAGMPVIPEPKPEYMPKPKKPSKYI